VGAARRDHARDAGAAIDLRNKSEIPGRRSDVERAAASGGPRGVDLDLYRRALKRKQAGLPPEQQPEAAPPTNVVNLMDALRRSVDAERPAAARGKAAERKKPEDEPERRPAKGRGRLPDALRGCRTELDSGWPVARRTQLRGPPGARIESALLPMGSK
jgi:hypothetical protein